MPQKPDGFHVTLEDARPLADRLLRPQTESVDVIFPGSYTAATDAIKFSQRIIHA